MRAASSSRFGSTDSKQSLASEFRNLVKDAEELLRTTSNYSGEGFAAARSKFEERLRQIRQDIPGTESFIRARYRQAATTTDRYVHEKPWQVLGTIAVVSILVGFFIGRR